MQDEDGNTEDSLSGDDEDQGGALSYFLPDVIPRMPHDLGLKASGVQVAQVHNDTCMAQKSAVIAHRHAASSQQRCCAP